MKIRSLLVIAMIVAGVFVSGCKKEEPTVPVVSEDAASSLMRSAEDAAKEAEKSAEAASKDASDALKSSVE